MHKKQAILFVVHKGKLEPQALLLAASLRYYNGEKYDLIACIPAQSGGLVSGVSTSVKMQLEQLNVQLVEVDNPIGNDYLIGNKLNCLSATNHSTRTFLDTDMICTKPLEFPILPENQIAVKPADRRTYGWSNQQWAKAYLRYAEYKLSDQDMMMSTCFSETMWPYFNAGLIHISGCPEFSKTWAKISQKLDQDAEFEDKRPWLDQLSLPLTIKKLKLKTHCLTEAFNFPANIKAVNKQHVSMVHYHRPELIADNRFLLNQLKAVDKQYEWLLPALSGSPEWGPVLTRLTSFKLTQKSPVNEYLVTEIPCSGMDTLCASLARVNGVELFDNPAKVIKPIGRRYVPWGIGLFFEKMQTQLEGTPETSNIVVSLGISLLTSISRVKRVKPRIIMIACINNPMETIKAWSIDYIQKLVHSELFNFNLQGLSELDKQLLAQYTSCQSETMKKALFWCFCANQLLHNPEIKLFHIDEIIHMPLPAIETLIKNKFSLPGYFVTGNNENTNLGLDSNDALVMNITNQVYKDLIDRMNAQRTAV